MSKLLISLGGEDWADYELLSKAAAQVALDKRHVFLPAYNGSRLMLTTPAGGTVSLEEVSNLLYYIADILEGADNYADSEQHWRHEPPRHFSKYAEKSDYHWRDYQRGTKYKRHADRVAEWVQEAHVLDVGAGDGMITSLLGSAAMGIDNEPEGVRLAQAHGVPVILGDAYHLDFPDGHFESVLMADVLEHFEFPEKALAEARRVLTKYIYITTPPKRPDGKLTDKYHWREYSPDELKAFVEGCGFELEGEIDVVLADKIMYGKFRKA